MELRSAMAFSAICFTGLWHCYRPSNTWLARARGVWEPWKPCFCWKCHLWNYHLGMVLLQAIYEKMRLLKIFEDVLNCVVVSLMIKLTDCCDVVWLIFETMLMEELRSRTCGWISSWTNTESRQIQHNPPNLPGVQDQTQDVQCRSVQPVASGTLW